MYFLHRYGYGGQPGMRMQPVQREKKKLYPTDSVPSIRGDGGSWGAGIEFHVGIFSHKQTLSPATCMMRIYALDIHPSLQKN